MTPTRVRRVLFVDDEQLIVNGLRRVLRAHRATWDVTTTTSSKAALAMLDTHAFDVLVSDMEMPEMDGEALLAAARKKCPATVRILLSGQSESAAALRVVDVAHQFLSKPMEPGLLVSVLNRVVSTRDMVGDPDILAAIGGVGRLPSAPRLCRSLAALASEEDVSVEDLAAEIEQDPAMVLKLLQIVNSAFFGLRRELSGVPEAVAYLGTSLVKNLVLSFSIIGCLPARASLFDIDAFQRRSLTVALVARLVAGSGREGDVSFVAGMLHAIGQLVLAFAVPETYDDIARSAAASHRSFEEEEAVRGGCDHRSIGGYLLHLWGLPKAVVEAVLEHPRVHGSARTTPTSADALHIALRLLAGPNGLDGAEDRALVSRLGLGPMLPDWFEQAVEISVLSGA